MTIDKIKVNISFEINSEDLEDLRDSIYALCSSASYPDLDTRDGKEYYPYWIHDLVERYNWNSYVNKEDRRVLFKNDPTCEVCLENT